MLFFYLGCSYSTSEKVKIWICLHSPPHLVSKTTLACTAAYNANIHHECFILVNLDQSVTKQATAIIYYKCRQIATKWANFFLLRMRLVYLWKKVKKTKSQVCIHSQPHCGQTNHTICTRAQSMCNTANSVHNKLHLGILFQQATMLQMLHTSLL